MATRSTALAYIRVSTDRQKNSGVSLPVQEEGCIKLAAERGFKTDATADVYTDGGESAQTMKRPALLDLLERCKTDKTIAAVIVYDVSRLSRNRLDFALIKMALSKRGIILLSVTEPIDDTPEGQMLEGVLLAVAEFFSAQSGRKVSAGMKKKAEQGGWPNGAPYGYQNRREKLPSGEERAWIEPHPTERYWVTRAFELYATGNHSLKALARALDHEGFIVRPSPRRKGTTVHHTFLERLLRNRIYVGVVEWGGIINENGIHEPLIEPSLFYRVQDLLLIRSTAGTRKRRHFSVLKGITFCDECGCRLTIDEKQTSTTKTIRYFRCLKQRASKIIKCSQKYHREEHYLGEVEKLLKRIELPKKAALKLQTELKTIFIQESTTYARSREALLSQLEVVMRRRKNLVLQQLDAEPGSTTDINLYKKIKTDLAGDERRLQDELARLDHRLGSVEETVDMALAIAASCHHAYSQVRDLEYKALIIRTVFKELRIKDGHIAKAALHEPLQFPPLHQGAELPLNHRGDLCLSGPPKRTLPEGGSRSSQQSSRLPRAVAPSSKLHEYLNRIASNLDSSQLSNIERCYAILKERSLLRIAVEDGTEEEKKAA